MLKGYREYKNITEFWLSSIPANWDNIKIKHLFKERVEKGHPNKPLLAATQSLGVVPKKLYGNRTVEASKDLHLLKLVKAGDFVISLRSFQGGIEYAYYEGIISPAYTIMIPDNNISVHYFRYLFKTVRFVELLQNCVTGIREGQNIDYSKLRNHLIPIPTRTEQEQIVRYLDWKISLINKYINAKKKQIELLKEQKQAIINQAVTKGLNSKVPMKESGIDWLGKIPKHWEVLDLKRVTKTVKTGGTPSGASEKYYSECGLDWYTPGDFSDDIFLKQSVRKLSSLGENEVKTFPPNTIFFIGIGGTLGKVSVSKKMASCNQQINAIICKSSYNEIFLTFYLRMIRNHIYNTAKYTTLPILNQEETKNIPVPFFDIAEQENIVNYLLSIENTYNKFISNLEKQIILIQEYRTRLISDVVTGKVDVQGIEAPEICIKNENLSIY